jgi:Flp pilus assembly protein TadD
MTLLKYHRPLLIMSMLGLVVLVSLAYHSATENGFHFDDLVNIRNHAPIRMESFSFRQLAQATTQGVNKHRWLPNMSFAIDWWRGGGNATTFQWTNLCIHGANTLLVFAFFLILTTHPRNNLDNRQIIAAFLGAALWAVHPIQIQAVTFIVQRMTLMAGGFTVLAVLCYLLGRSSKLIWKSRALLAIAAVSFLFGALSKENALVAPVLIALAELGAVRDQQPLFKNSLEKGLTAVLLMTGAGIIAFTLAGIGPVYDYYEAAYRTRDFTMWERVLTQPRVLAFHFFQLLWPMPWRFSLAHDVAISTSLLQPMTTLPAILALVAWCSAGITLLARRGFRLLGFLMLWFPVATSIESSIVPLEMIFEHRMYLPSIGFFGLLTLFLNRHLHTSRLSAFSVALPAVLILGGLTISTLVRVPAWKTDRTLWAAATHNAPNSARVWASLGRAQLIEGDRKLAERSSMRALENDHNETLALETMGVIELDRGNLPKAASYLSAVVHQGLAGPSVLNHLGEVYLARGDYAGAERLFGAAIVKAPWRPSYIYNRARAREAMSRCREALMDWITYLSLETSEDDQILVRRHILEEYRSERGACYNRLD